MQSDVSYDEVNVGMITLLLLGWDVTKDHPYIRTVSQAVNAVTNSSTAPLLPPRVHSICRRIQLVCVSAVRGDVVGRQSVAGHVVDRRSSFSPARGSRTAFLLSTPDAGGALPPPGATVSQYFCDQFLRWGSLLPPEPSTISCQGLCAISLELGECDLVCVMVLHGVAQQSTV